VETPCSPEHLPPVRRARFGCWSDTAPTFEARHVHTSRPGDQLNQDTFYWGTLKDVGKLYVEVIVDVSCSFAFAEV
jgi:hypothetical protein